MIKALLIALIMSVSVKPGTVERVNRDIVTINDGSDYWDVYADGYISGDKVNMVFCNDKVVALF